MKLLSYLLIAGCFAVQAQASETTCRLGFAGRFYDGAGPDFRSAKEQAIRECESRWIAPVECARAAQFPDALRCNTPPPAAWQCTLGFGGRIYRGEAQDRRSAKEQAIRECESRWIAPVECARAGEFDDAMRCVPVSE